MENYFGLYRYIFIYLRQVQIHTSINDHSLLKEFIARVYKLVIKPTIFIMIMIGRLLINYRMTDVQLDLIDGFYFLLVIDRDSGDCVNLMNDTCLIQTPDGRFTIADN